MQNLLMGLDIGQMHEASGLCVVEVENRAKKKGFKPHYLVRYLERLPAGARFPDIVAWTAEIAAKAREKVGGRPNLAIDATGLGDPVLQLFRKGVPKCCIYEIYFNYGDQRTEESHTKIRLGKCFLVSRLQALLQEGKLHLPTKGLNVDLAQELLDFQLKIDEKANERYGAFRVGRHDELVTALGMAVQQEPSYFHYTPRSPPRHRRLSFIDTVFGDGPKYRYRRSRY